MRGVQVHWHSQGEAHVPSDPTWLGEREAERAGGMRFAKRRTEYLLGRWTAKQAVSRHLGLPLEPAALAHVEIASASDGAPEVLARGAPASLSVSLSDRAGWAICAVGAAGIGLGCDLELVETRSEAFVADYFVAEERELVSRAADAEDRDTVANLLWCAKESALKVLRTGLRRDTRSVRVEPAPRPAAAGWLPLDAYLAEGGCLTGWWRRFGPFLLSVLSDVETEPPVALVEPPALEGAVPTHSWLAQPRLFGANE